MAKDRRNKRDYRALLAERDEEINRLHSQLSLRIQHSEHLEARLLSTLDTLDELQAASSQEIHLAQQENERLTKRLDHFSVVVRNADREKSDMANAIMQLVSKIESCSDFSKWHAARVQLTDTITLEPQRRTTHIAGSRQTECMCPNAYSPAVVKELSDALAREQKAHALSVSESERRIASLRERLAAREAEIATREVACQCRLPKYALARTGHNQVLAREHITAQTQTRNRVLRDEVDRLNNMLQLELGSNIRADQSIQTDVDLLDNSIGTNNDDSEDPIKVALHALDSEIAQLREGLATLSQEKETLRSVLMNQLGTRQTSETNQSVSNHSPNLTESLISLNDDDEDEECPANSRQPGGNFDNILLLEEECIRLMKTEEELHSELSRSHGRELVLQEENKRLLEVIERIRRDDVVRSAAPSPEEHWVSPSFESREIGFRSSAPGSVAHTIFTPNNGSEEEPDINLSFPPIEPDSILMVSPDENYYEPETSSSPPHPPPETQRSSNSSTSSPSLQTPPSINSSIDPSEIPLPPTPPPLFDEDTIALDRNSSNNYNYSLSSVCELDILRTSSSSSSNRSPAPAPRQRNAEEIARELAEARADSDFQTREIASVRGVIASLARQVVVGQGNTGPWAALLSGNDSQHEAESRDSSESNSAIE